MVNRYDIASGGDRVGGLRYREVEFIVVDEEVCFLKECAAKCVLIGRFGAADGKVVGSIRIKWLGGLEIESCIWKGDVEDLLRRRP